MSNKDLQETDILAVKNGLAQLGQAIDTLANRELPKPSYANDEISGDMVHGGTISQFTSVGIQDRASKQSLIVENDKISVDSIDTVKLLGDVQVERNLNVVGTVHAQKMIVNELQADVRNERTSPLQFNCETESLYGKGLMWTGVDYTRQLVMQAHPDRLWSTEDFDLREGKEFKVNNKTVVSETALGETVQHSSLRTVGTLRNLKTEGNLNIDQFIFYDGDGMRLGIGTEAANGQLSVCSNEVEFIVDPDYNSVKTGTYTTHDLKIVTDDQVRIEVNATGKITLGTDVESQVTVKGKLGIGVKNPDTPLHVGGPIKFQGKKFEVGNEAPQNGLYSKGDIIWNENPTPTGYVGWVCVRNGTPGEWKPFGMIGAQKMQQFDKHVTVWSWIGRVLPLTALLTLCLVIITDLPTVRDWIILGIAVGFGTTAFIWWWWVIYAVRSLTTMLDDNKKRFNAVVEELRSIRKDIKKLPKD